MHLRDTIHQSIFPLMSERAQVEEGRKPGAQPTRTHGRQTLHVVDGLSAGSILYQRPGGIDLMSMGDADGWVIERCFLIANAVVAQRKQKSDEVLLLRLGQADRRNVNVEIVLVGTSEVPAPIVEIHDLHQSGFPTVVELSLIHI